MNSLNNTNVLSKSMNGLNVITADQINTNNFTATNLSTTSLTTNTLSTIGNATIYGTLMTSGGIDASPVQTINFGANVPTSSGTASSGNDLINKTYADSHYAVAGSYVDTTTNQTIGGIKTFSNPPVMSGASIQTATMPKASISDLATIVQTSGSQFVNGTKTFQAQSVFQGGTSIIDGQREVIANTNRNLWYGSNTNSNWNLRTDNTIVGQQAGLVIGTGASSTANTALGSYALATASNSNGNVALGHQSMRYATTCSGNCSVGTYSGLGMLTGCNSNNFFGSASGSAIITNSSYNWASGESAMSNPFPTIYTSKYFDNGTDLTGTYTITLDDITYLQPSMRVIFNGGVYGGSDAYINQINISTKTLTLSTNTWRCGAYTYIIFYTRGQLIQTTYSGATATNTTFTIPTGLALTNAYRLAYYESSNIMKYADVSTYTSGTGVLVLTTSITLLGGSTLYFYNSITDKGNNMNNNLALGKYSLANINTGTNNSTAIGIGALNGCWGGYNNINSCFYDDCTGIGYNAGANATGYMVRMVFIGSGADVNDLRMNYLQDCICIGSNAKLTKNMQIVIGHSSLQNINIGGGRIEYDADTLLLTLTGDTNVTGLLTSNTFQSASVACTNFTLNTGVISYNTGTDTFDFAGNLHLTPDYYANFEGTLICNQIDLGLGGINNCIVNDYIQMINANGNCLVGVNNTSGVNDVGTNNYAFGKDSLINITSTSNNNYSAGIGVNGGLTQSCQWNTGIGHNVMETSYGPASCYVKNTGSSQTGVTTLTLPSIPALVKIGQTVNTYGASLNQFVATVTAINTTGLQITLSASVNCATGTYVYFYDVGKLTATYTPSGTLIGTSFTIATGLAINSSSKCSYKNTFLDGQTVMVTSYNSGTGAIVFASSITAAASQIMYFNDTSETAGSQIWGNTVNGTFSLNRICSYSSFNTAIGYNSLNSSNTTPISYFGGANNTIIGSSCAANNLKFLSSNNTLIGCAADVNSSVDGNNIQYSTAIGAGAMIDSSNQIKLGRSSETVSIPGACTITGNLTNSGTFAPTNITMGQTTLINGIYAPYYVAPTITGTPTNPVALPTNPIPGVLFVYNTLSPAADITITLPLITAEMIGIQIRCKRFGNNNNVRINCASGNTAIGQTSLGSVSQNGQTLIPTAAYNGTLICISMTQWACYS